MSPKRKAPLGIEHALLGFLQHAPLHPYEMHVQLGAGHALGAVWRLKQAHMYALIDRLEAEVLITSEVVMQEGRPPKRLLHLTAAGRHAFHVWRSTPVPHGRDLRIEFLAKLFWAQHESPAVAAELIRRQRTLCRAWLGDLLVDQEPGDVELFAELVTQFRISQIEAMLRWLDACAATLEQNTMPSA